jgi:Escherichia/Staphylococcus phage prohead protease
MPTTSPSGLAPADAVACLPHKTFDCEFKSIDDAGGFTLYAAVFGNVDRGSDLIEPGAFTNLDEFVKDGWIALNHQSSQLPVAMVDDATQDGHGLKVTGRWHSTPEAQACRTVVKERLEAGKAVKTSIGYGTIEESYEKTEGRTIRHLLKLAVYEVSFVNLPMNPRAEVISAKGHAPPSPEEEAMSDTLDQLKRLLGISVKRSVAISAANHATLKGHCDAMDEHVKAMKDCHKCLSKSMDEMKSFVAGFGPDAADDDDDADAPVKPKPKKDDADGDAEKSAKPPAVVTEADKTKAALLDQLKHRSLLGRRNQACP